MSSDQSPKQGSKPNVRVTHTSSDAYESQATPMLSKAFENDPIFTYIINKVPKISRPNTLETLVHLVLTSGILKHATFYESGSLQPHEQEEDTEPKFECVAVFVPPGKQVNNLGLHAWCVLVKHGVLPFIWQTGIRGISKILIEYQRIAEQAKKKVLTKGEPYYYLLIVGTDPGHRGKGLCAATIREHQKVAQEESVPIWLEASNKGAMTVYTKVGFTVIDGEWMVGKGKCDANGEKAKGAEAVGVEFFPMVWWPEGYVKK
jgi:GNAT superfamily N-acetyltransferase